MRFPDSARRARIGRRHGLNPAHRLDDPLGVAQALVALHATDPSTVHLAVAPGKAHVFDGKSGQRL